MTQARTSRGVAILVAIGLAFALAVASGCSSKPDAAGDKTGSGTTANESTTSTATASPTTAKAGIEKARSALSTMAPDAKLLMVQTAQAVTATSTPVWGYLFGSPKSDKTFVVYVANGAVMRAGEYGKAGMSKSDWADVGADDAFTVDSDVAYKKALAVSGAKTAPPRYLMGLQTYVSKDTAKKTGAAPYVWYVVFDPGASGATSSTIDVDANTGKAVIHPKDK